jgi:hypothetical protein
VNVLTRNKSGEALYGNETKINALQRNKSILIIGRGIIQEQED